MPMMNAARRICGLVAIIVWGAETFAEYLAAAAGRLGVASFAFGVRPTVPVTELAESRSRAVVIGWPDPTRTGEIQRSCAAAEVRGPAGGAGGLLLPKSCRQGRQVLLDVPVRETIPMTSFSEQRAQSALMDDDDVVSTKPPMPPRTPAPRHRGATGCPGPRREGEGPRRLSDRGFRPRRRPARRRHLLVQRRRVRARTAPPGQEVAPLAGRDPGAPHHRSEQRSGRSSEPVDQADQALGPRVPQPHQLPAPHPPRWRHAPMPDSDGSRASEPAVPGSSRRARSATSLR